MPNYCSIRIFITGKVDRFSETIIDDVFSFEQTVPPTEYDDHATIWGTKWDICDSVITLKTDDTIIIDGETAWSPPIKWARTCAQKYPEVQIRVVYCECGMGYYGMDTLNGDSRKDFTSRIPEGAYDIINQDDPIIPEAKELGETETEISDDTEKFYDFCRTYKITRFGG